MKNKKGFELAANFIVVLIISVVIFAGGIGIANKFFDKANEIQKDIDAETDAQIEALLDDGDSQVVIPINEYTVRKGEGKVFGVGVLNTLGTNKDFYLTINFSEAVTSTNEVITGADSSFINSNWILYTNEKNLDNNEKGKFSVNIRDKGSMSPVNSTYKGTYIFNVYVCSSGDMDFTDSICDGKNSKSELYDDKVHKLYLKIK